ncbi:alpha/beta fold hydrolase [Sphaerotilus uruguayifluvii]|uniref:Pimeloyl-ACP methyl ester carboxylesterase n=1 Tax=Sphaerotilus uruguayifluvii TaxID=2735897 RepID=A0ABX2G9S7_9BURK|nr:alpha/beta fold hydrolase [Leptothrix sp. C29]NRT58287.1 pimeloyl-ACP methyl ester carboxylesterase [Leptothrix sp. C29]
MPPVPQMTDTILRPFTVNGRRLLALTGAAPVGPDAHCVVFVHGALNDHGVWSGAVEDCLRQGQAVLAPDLPGHGGSEGPADTDVAAMAGTLVALLQAAGLARVTLVGHSMGSLIALDAAARLADSGEAPRVERLVMVGTAFPMRVAPALLQQAGEAPLEAIGLIASLSHAGEAAGLPARQQAGVERMHRVLDGCPPAWLPEGSRTLLELDLAACDRHEGAPAAMQRLMQAPARPRCHLICAEQDRMTPVRRTGLLLEGLQARLHLLPQAGHTMMEDDPAGFAAALQAALGDDAG